MALLDERSHSVQRRIATQVVSLDPSPLASITASVCLIGLQQLSVAIQQPALLCHNPQCRLPLIPRAFQTNCGCFLCQFCMESFKRQFHDSGDHKQPCPGATDFCQPEGISPDQIRRDLAKEREVQQMRLPCPNHCSPESKLLSTLLNHLQEECPQRPVSCPQCSLHVPLQLLQRHEKEECVERPKVCEDCGVILHWRQYEQHRDLRSGDACCEKLRSSCPFCGASEEPSGFSRESITRHLKLECSQFQRSCPFAVIHCCPQKDPPFVGIEEELSKHLLNSLNDHLVLLKNKSELGVTQQQQLQETVQNLAKDVHETLASAENQSKKMQKSLSTILDQISKPLLNEPTTSSSMASPTPRISSSIGPSSPSSSSSRLSPTVTPPRQPMSVQVSGNEFVVKLFDYGAHRAAAQQSGMSDVGVETEPLYVQTSRDLPGYRLKLRIYFNGRGSGYNSHLSVYFLLVAGEWDDLLQWPFLHKISFALLRKWPPTPMQTLTNGNSPVGCVTLRPSPDSPVAQRPLPEGPGEAAGQPLLIPFPLLEQHFLLKDSFYLHVKVHDLS